jgi:hypothetical protein
LSLLEVCGEGVGECGIRLPTITELEATLKSGFTDAK